MATFNKPAQWREYYRPGIGKVGQYQVAGVPYVTSSIPVPAPGEDTQEVNLGIPAGSEVKDTEVVEIQFPYVTKRITIINDITASEFAPLRYGFSYHGVKGISGIASGHTEAGEGAWYGVLHNSSSITMDVRVERLYLRSHSTSELGATASVIAELTYIPTGSTPFISSSEDRFWGYGATVGHRSGSFIGGGNWSGSAGVG